MPLSSDVQIFHCIGDVLVVDCHNTRLTTLAIVLSHFSQWVELKALLISVANPPFNETCYIFTDLGAVANGFAI